MPAHQAGREAYQRPIKTDKSWSDHAMIKCSRLALAGLGSCAALLLTGTMTQVPASAATATPGAAAAQARPAGDGPPGFWWGTDSLPVTVPGRAPYQMPYLGGAYGGYIGMT